MAAEPYESNLANLLVGLLEIILNIILLPFYIIIGILSLFAGSLVVFVIGLLLLAMAILCGLTVVAI